MTPAPFDPTQELTAPSSTLSTLVLRLSSPRHRAGATCILEPGAATEVGSAPTAGLQLEEATLSARHCRISHRETHVEIEDLGSTNGLEIGGAAVACARVWPGASVTLGAAVLEVMEAPRNRDTALAGVEPLPGIAGSSVPMLRLASRVRRLARLGLPVLLRGETGTGKELVARALHRESGLAGAFVALNAAAISSTLAESELFGHRRGAFTGAVADRRGAFCEADGGTLFLDEVASLPLAVQAKLLRVVEEGIVRPLGGEATRAVRVRLIAATCEPMESLVERGAFRADLYERLATCVVRLPALRERRSDIPELAVELLAQLGFGNTSLSRTARRALETRTFRGNVRELRNVLAGAAVLAGAGNTIEPEHLQEAIEERNGPRTQLTSAELARSYEMSGRNTSATARALGVPRTTVRDALRRFHERKGET